MRFRDREDAGRQLVEAVRALGLVSPVVLGLPRGGVPVAAQVAQALAAPLDVFVARKIGLPGHEEFGIGAVAEGALDPVRSAVVSEVGLREDEFDAIARRARDEVVRRVELYRQGRRLPDLRGRDVVLVDDGLATGVTAEAALRSLRAFGPARLVLAAPVCARETAARLRRIADDVVCVGAPDDFTAVGRWYENFSQTTDAEVLALLATRPVDVREVAIPTGDEIVKADLSTPDCPRGLVVFAHGSGSSRRSLRNRYVAEYLQEAGFATLLLDLLTEAEEQVDIETRRVRFDIAFLAQRLVDAVGWLDQQPTAGIPIGYFGASTGAAAALVAAAMQGARIDAVVSRGGRPDLAGDALGRVRAPTLLIVGSRDTEVAGLNHTAVDRMQVESRLELVDGATHLFEEPGALEQVARHASDWFNQHLGAARPAQSALRRESARSA